MLPAITFPPELPVSQKREDIARAIRENQVIIVAGETGSGKTTQLPKICLELGRENIGHTQPRRIAARSIAERVAEELGQEVGGLVGYQVRFTDESSAQTRIKLMTDGILLNEIHHDRELSRYDTIIIDEAHERSLNIDFLLGYLHRLLPRRPDLKVIVTSATIDPESFSRHFGGAPVIEVSGRTFPVDVRYRPLVRELAPRDDDEELAQADTVDLDPIDGIVAALDELSREEPGDVLVFLSGETEIRDAQDTLTGLRLPFTEVLPLFGRLSSADQHRVFRRTSTPGIRRRIVLATNVAETSLTVPGIRYVIDTGTARISRYSTRSKVQRLPIEAISQASAQQRSGRSGRTSPGIAIRLYSEEDFRSRPEFTEPEILRTNLAAVILQMISLGLGDVTAFPFLTPPDPRGVKDGLDLLAELGAVVRAGGKTGLTKVGRELARLPIDPRFGRMVLEARAHGVGREVLAIVAGLTIQDPRERPLEQRGRADELHSRFADPTSDFLTLLNLWNHLEQQQRELSSSAFRRLCKAEYLNFVRVREWNDVYRQLRQLSRSVGLRVGEPRIDPEGIHKSLLAGLLSHIGLRDQARRDYLGARQTRFVVFPGSTLAKKQPAAVMAAELVETSRLFARTVAAIDPAWAEPIAGSLCKRSHSEPRWEKRQGSAVADEKVTLFGVPIIPRRRVQYARIDPVHARELFVRHALVEGEWESRHPFDRANRRLRRELEEREERTRRRDVLVDDEAIYDFYDRRIPRDIVSVRTFEAWWKDERERAPELLTLRPEDLLPEDAPAVDEDEYPSTWRQGDQTLRLSYRFEPGADDDGVTATVPVALLAGLSPNGFDWQVPGLRHDLVTALLRSLPKAIRRHVVPAADWAARLAQQLPDEPSSASLTESLARLITRAAGVPVDPSDFDLDRVPAHLRLAFRVVDENGRELGRGDDLGRLQQELADQARAGVARAAERSPHALERDHVAGWDVDELPRTVDVRQAGNVIRAYPAFVAEKDGVALRILATEADQRRELPGGIRRLLLAAVPSPVAYVQQHLTAAEKLSLAASPYRTTRALFEDCLVACLDEVLYRTAPEGMLFTRAEFEALRDRVNGVVMDAMFETVSLVARILTAARAAEKSLKQASGDLTVLPALQDARVQLEGLVHPGFVARTGRRQLREIPRYLAGLEHRLTKLRENPARDRAWMLEVHAAVARYEAAGGTIPPGQGAPPALTEVRWMIEEFRVGLFAQHLGTARTVSLQRITKAIAAA